MRPISPSEERTNMQVFYKLEERFCNEQLLLNPRIVDVVEQLEKLIIKRLRLNSVPGTTYVRYIRPRILSWVDNSNHFKLTQEGNIRIYIPRREESSIDDFYEKRKEIEYNGLPNGMEKIILYSWGKGGTEKYFKSLRYVYDKNGIETERQTEIYERNVEGTKNMYIYRERLKDKPHIIKETINSKKQKENGKVKYYNIQDNCCIEDEGYYI